MNNRRGGKRDNRRPHGPGADRPQRPASRPAPRAEPARASPLPDLSAIAPLPAPPEFTATAESMGIAFEPGDVEKLGRYLAMLLAANEAINLTAIKDAEAGWTKHILDSLTLLPYLAEFAEGTPPRVIDVGSGGGLPGLPLAIALPPHRFTLLEATEKKAAFLREAAAALGLPNVEVVVDRAEAAAQDRGQKTHEGRVGAMREAFDFVTARAVGRLATLAELTCGFAKINGRLLLIKGQAADEELEEAAAALHDLKLVHAGTVDTPTGRIVVIEKRSATPRLYPRRDGEPKRSPLGVGKARPSA